MIRLSLTITTFLFTVLLASAADPPKDTLAANFTRTKKLKGKVTIEFKETELGEALLVISEQLEDQKLGQLCVQFGTGASRNARVTLSAKDAPLEDVLDGLLKPHELGYHVLSKEKDRHDGWLVIAKGTERGFPPGVTPLKSEPKKASDEDEKAATAKLDVARQLLDEKKSDRAKTVLKFIVKHYPDTKAGADAKDLLEKLDK